MSCKTTFFTRIRHSSSRKKILHTIHDANYFSLSFYSWRAFSFIFNSVLFFCSVTSSFIPFLPLNIARNACVPFFLSLLSLPLWPLSSSSVFDENSFGCTWFVTLVAYFSIFSARGANVAYLAPAGCRDVRREGRRVIFDENVFCEWNYRDETFVRYIFKITF